VSHDPNVKHLLSLPSGRGKVRMGVEREAKAHALS
jgi:hypothetical protein